MYNNNNLKTEGNKKRLMLKKIWINKPFKKRMFGSVWSARKGF